MIRALIFDCFGVLYVDPSHDFYEKQVPNYTELRPQLMDLNKQSDYGLITQDEWKQAVAEVTGLATEDVKQNIQGVHLRNQALLDYSQELRASYKVGMLSNIGTGAMDGFFSKDERDRLFEAVVLSAEVGLVKPHPEIFKLMADRLGVGPGECVMIDDIEDNCAGADAAGMLTVHYRTSQQARADLEVLLEANRA